MTRSFVFLSVLACLTVESFCDVFSIYGNIHEPYEDPTRPIDGCLTQRVSCQNGKEEFSNLDGTCNNLAHPTWGASNSAMRRYLPPEYDDSKGSPRTQGEFRKLPSTRKISNALKDSQQVLASGISHLHVLWGQLLAHDIVHTPIIKTPSGKKIDCNCDRPDPDCINIEIPADDQQRMQTGKKCFSLARSLSAKGIDGCRFPHREQLSTMSSVIDGTFIYGKSQDEANDLRDLTSASGEIKLVNSPTGGAHKYLPNQNELRHKKISESIDCDPKVHKPVNTPCFVAGDVRLNENPGLQSIQTVWTRYHNLIARGLKAVNPFWTGDRIFNAARKIVSAVVQSITYREYLPPLLGPTWMERFGLKLVEHGYWNGYDARYHNAISTSFTTAAFRFGHSQVAETMTRPSSVFGHSGIPDVPSASTFFSTEALLEKNGGGPGALLRGFMVDNAERMDDNFADALRNHLFVQHGKKFGGDLFAINIQRGRDHGLPGYNKFRELCGLSRSSTFGDLAGEISQQNIKKLQTVYDHVDDIDLYVGGLEETHVTGGEVGPTFACLLADVFRGLRKGDRYWHEYEHSPSPFTPNQLQSIRQISLASVFCQTGEDMKYSTKNSMLMQKGSHGSFVNCGNLPKIDVSLWRDDPFRYNSVSPRREVEWTTWFILSDTDEQNLNVANIMQEFKERRPEDMCNDVINYETRNVRGDTHLQIRFSCHAGAISSTDFPFQISQEHKWSKWFQRQNIEGFEFGCDNIIAIQAMTLRGQKFAKETGDVFEKFGAEGFSCQDHQQFSGFCHRYNVRALCSGKTSSPKPTFSPTTPRVPPTAQTTTSYSPLLPHVEETAKFYCRQYSRCCSPPSRFYTISIPEAVMGYGRHLCKIHRVCCDI